MLYSSFLLHLQGGNGKDGDVGPQGPQVRKKHVVRGERGWRGEGGEGRGEREKLRVGGERESGSNLFLSFHREQVVLEDLLVMLD